MTSRPGPLTPQHVLDPFSSGTPSLDLWLKQRALRNERERASRTYVLCEEDRVIAYYSLAVGSVPGAEVPGRIRRNMPDPIPVMILGRLAVDEAWQGRGLGGDLLRDALLRTLNAAEIAGIRALLVHAISPEAKRFYERFGFRDCPEHPMTLLVALRDAQAML